MGKVENNLGKEIARENRKIAIRKFTKNKMSMIGLGITVLFLLVAIVAKFLPNDSVYAIHSRERLLAPSMEHLFGTDTMGRDLLARTMSGVSISMEVGVLSTLFAVAIGVIIGVLSAYYRVMDNIFMRICEGLMAIPSILLAVSLMAALGGSTKNVIFSIALTSIPSVAKNTRAVALSVIQQTYIEAARADGSKVFYLIFRHVIPNSISPAIVQSTYLFAASIAVEAALSFLGAGVPTPAPTLGNILYEAKDVMGSAWWMVVMPGISMVSLVLGLNLLGDGLRDFMDSHSN